MSKTGTWRVRHLADLAEITAFLERDRWYAAYAIGDLEPGLFAFYFHRRNLEDLTDWIIRIMDENSSEEQDRDDLSGIQEDCLSWWDDLEAGTRLREVVAGHSVPLRADQA